MALGGGTWQAQNKILPGTYINFSSLRRASANLSTRGIAAAPFTLSWGPESTVIKVTSEDFRSNCLDLFGYAIDHDKMLYLREIFTHATTVYCYRLGTGATKAENIYATAKYGGVRGNDITIVIAANADDSDMFDVSTVVDGITYDTQTVETAAGLKSNGWVDFKMDASLVATAGTPLTGGSDKTQINGTDHQNFLDAISSYSFNTLCCGASDAATVAVYAAFAKRMRDTVGSKFQLVAWQANADYEGVIGVWNIASHGAILGVDTHALVYWVAGAQAGVEVNKSLTNTIYDGELTIDVSYTQSQLEDAIKAGKFMFHNVNGEVRILDDINTLVSLTDEKGEIFQSNQTVRVCDQIANDTAVLFNARYAGTVPNDASGRATLWNDVVKLMQELERIRAIENFSTEIVSVELGNSKKAVQLTINGLNIVNAMAQLYMSVIIQ